MSIITELMECIRTANRSYEDARNPYNDREILHIPEEELTAIAKRIRKANNDAINKAHADGERSAIKQIRSKSEDYRRGYAAGYAKGQEERMGDNGTEHIEGSSKVRAGSSITDELREYAVEHECDSYRKLLNRIADRIDAEHERKVRQAHADGLNEQIDYRDNFIPSNYVMLPVDADGEVIHIGDKMDCGEHFGVQEVEGFIHGAVAFTVCDPQPARICTCPAHMTHHYHAPTVENVLEEFVARWMETHHDDIPALKAEYATKLRLAGDAE